MIWILLASNSKKTALPRWIPKRLISADEASHTSDSLLLPTLNRTTAIWPIELSVSTRAGKKVGAACAWTINPSCGMTQATGLAGGILPLSSTSKNQLFGGQSRRPALKTPLNTLGIPTNSATLELRGFWNNSFGAAVCRPMPWSITVILSASKFASRKSCVTKTIGIARSWRNSAKIRYRFWRVGLSIAENGSSNNNTLGFLAKARASATRCCCPPDSCAGKRSANWPRAIRSSHACDCAIRVDFGRPLFSKAIATLCKADKWGKRAYCWNKKPQERCAGEKLIRGLFALNPSNHISPAHSMSPNSGWCKPAMVLSAVVLPLPDGPTKACNSPAAQLRLISKGMLGWWRLPCDWLWMRTFNISVSVVLGVGY